MSDAFTMNSPSGLDQPIEANFSVKLSAPPSSAEVSSFEVKINEQIAARGVTAIFGPSGCGKTTLLRAMAGLQPIHSGFLRVKGVTWHDHETNLPAHKRPVGFIFQEASLFEHLTVAGNLNFASKRALESVRPEQFQEIIELLDIVQLLSQKPAQLSGGERQRVAIARALLIRPQLLLMDEPLAAVDQTRKREILPFLDRLRTELNLPIIYVTHALDEVTWLADDLLIMENGLIEASGSVDEVLTRLDVPRMLGEEAGAIVEGIVTERDTQWHLVRMDFNGGHLWLRDSGEVLGQSARIRILARDISLSLVDEQASSILNRLSATVIAMADDTDQAMVMVRLAVGKTVLLARISKRSASQLKLHQNQMLWIQIKSVAILN